MTAAPRAGALLVALVPLLVTALAQADPQAHVGLRTGVCGTGERGQFWQETAWCNGASADLLFLRDRNADAGIGPYVEVSSAGFFDLRYGGGLTLLAPLLEDFPVLISGGVYGHEARAVALGGSVFFGARSYNFHGAYNLAAGVFANVQHDIGARGATLVSAGLELDAFLLALPIVYLVSAAH